MLSPMRPPSYLVMLGIVNIAAAAFCPLIETGLLQQKALTDDQAFWPPYLAVTAATVLLSDIYRQGRGVLAIFAIALLGLPFFIKKMAELSLARTKFVPDAPIHFGLGSWLLWVAGLLLLVHCLVASPKERAR
jgi:hypothetical protein